ncbi:CvpA family protein, partial [Campylobacter jejuni]
NFAKNSYTLNLLKETGSFIMNQPLTENSLDHASEKLQDIVSDLNNTQKGE